MKRQWWRVTGQEAIYTNTPIRDVRAFTKQGAIRKCRRPWSFDKSCASTPCVPTTR